MELSEDELKNFFKVWAAVLVSLSYCYTVGKLTPKGYTRFLLIIPIIALFIALPLNLTSFHLGGMTAFFIAWLANFKLILFAFGQGPLCSHSSISFPLFLALACFPIKIQQNPSATLCAHPTPGKTESYPDEKRKSQNKPHPDEKAPNKSYPSSQNSQKSQNMQYPDEKTPNKSYPSPEKPQQSPWNYIIKGVLLALIIKIYDYTDQIHPKIIWFIFCFHIYFFLELVLALCAASVKLFLGFELDPPFDEPLLSSSLQDFWGRRWNIMVTRILRPTVYLPTMDFSTRIIGRKWAQLPAMMATFVVSAVMHELIFYYVGRVQPTLEVTCFFLLHGVCLCVEVVVKKVVGGKWSVPRWISGPATLAFVLATGFWLFLPPLVRAGLDTRPFQEYAALGKFVRSLKQALKF